MTETTHHHDAAGAPSGWITRFAPRISAGGAVLDLAAGGGRHGRYLLEMGFHVTLTDRKTDALADLAEHQNAEVIQADLEDGSDWPLGQRRFDAVVVANYLHRPLFPAILGAIAHGGLLIYETFALGNEAFGKPSNPDFLLRPGELLEAVRGTLRVLAYEDLIVDTPKPAAAQRICARKEA